MREKMARKLQKLCKWVSFNTVGRSMPPGMGEIRVSKELKEAIERMRSRENL